MILPNHLAVFEAFQLSNQRQKRGGVTDNHLVAGTVFEVLSDEFLGEIEKIKVILAAWWAVFESA